MPLKTDLPSHPSKPVAAFLVASLLIILLGAGAVWVSTQVTMVPSAVPANMAVEAERSKSSLSSNAYSGLHLSSAGPLWKDISPAQRDILSPLHARWESMGSLAKRRWLVLADRYPSMNDAERTKLFSRMHTWASLSAQQRNQARLNFKDAKRLSAGDLQSKWDEYQALSEAEKQRLAEQALKSKKTPRVAKRRLARIPAEPESNPEKTAPPTVTSNPVESAPVFTPQAAPSVVLPPLNAAPHPPAATPTETHLPPTAASLPVVVPSAEPVVDIPPLEDWAGAYSTPPAETALQPVPQSE